MKVFMMADLEGISGVVSFKHQAHPDGYLYPEARKSLMRDLNAAIEGAVACFFIIHSRQWTLFHRLEQ